MTIALTIAWVAVVAIWFAAVREYRVD